MASPIGEKGDSSQTRPRQLHVSRSFSRLEPTQGSLSMRGRASTFQNGTMTEDDMAEEASTPMEIRKPRGLSGVFARSFGIGEREGQSTIPEEGSGKLPSDFDDLPIELVSLTDSFIDSLSAKVHPSPPSVDKLSGLFQDFYATAANHIDTHISTLSSRQHRNGSPAPSVSSLSSTANKLRAKASSISSKEPPKVHMDQRDTEQQMLTTEEIVERKQKRKALEQKRLELEEAVERRACEGIYDRIWRHRSTQDEAQDEKLRSKTAALSVVGIGLTDLGIDLGDDFKKTAGSSQEKEDEVREWLTGAREELVLMNDPKYPLGKLQHLKAAHKGIVDTLSHFHPSSSADEIMPMLIYTLITSPPEGINVISNLYFIQRFRNESKIDGEAAYCLTNLEAAITFLETVDLNSLRADEAPSGPRKSASRPSTPRIEQGDHIKDEPTSIPGLTAPTLSPAAINAQTSSATLPSTSLASPASTLRPAHQIQNRRLSDIFQTPAQAIGNAGEAVLNTADQNFKNISNSLGDSYKFLVGKLKEQQNANAKGSEVVVPKTLDDARKLIGTPSPDDDAASESGASSLHSREDGRTAEKSDKMLNIIGGRKQPGRDRSADSLRSSSSNRKVTFTQEGKEKEKEKEKEKTASPLSLSTPAPANPALVESMRNLGNTLNPMNRFAGMGMMKGFGRSTPPVSSASDRSQELGASKSVPDGGIADLTSTFPDLAASLPPKEKTKVDPPIKRFMEVENPGDLKINEVLELLRDYRRLAGVLKDLDVV